MFIIYRATSPSGKVYIGLTKNLMSRKRVHKYHALHETKGNYPFYRALKKYGIDNFLWDEIDSADNLKLANELEIKHIKDHNSTNNKFGYNVSLGGNLVENIRRPRGKDHPYFGRKLSEAQHKNMIKGLMKKVICSTGEIFDSRADAGKKYNVTEVAISSNISGRTKLCVGLKFKDYFGDEYNQYFSNEDRKLTRKEKHSKRPIIRSDGTKYCSIYDACKKLGNKRPCDLHRALSGRRKTYLGYTWSYAKNKIAHGGSNE